MLLPKIFALDAFLDRRQEWFESKAVAISAAKTVFRVTGVVQAVVALKPDLIDTHRFEAKPMGLAMLYTCLDDVWASHLEDEIGIVRF